MVRKLNTNSDPSIVCGGCGKTIRLEDRGFRNRLNELEKSSNDMKKKETQRFPQIPPCLLLLFFNHYLSPPTMQGLKRTAASSQMAKLVIGLILSCQGLCRSLLTTSRRLRPLSRILGMSRSSMTSSHNARDFLEAEPWAARK